MLMVVEHGHSGRRGLNASWVQAGVPAGSLLANAVFTLFSRCPTTPFCVGAGEFRFCSASACSAWACLSACRFTRVRCFRKIRDRKRQAAVPFFEVLKRYPRNVVLAIGARMAENGGFYIFSVFVLTYATVNLELPRTVVLNCLLIATVLQFVAIPVFGLLSDASAGARCTWRCARAGRLRLPVLLAGGDEVGHLDRRGHLDRAWSPSRPCTRRRRPFFPNCSGPSPLHGSFDRLPARLAAGRRTGPADLRLPAQWADGRPGRRGLSDRAFGDHGPLRLARSRDAPHPTRRPRRAPRLNERHRKASCGLTMNPPQLASRADRFAPGLVLPALRTVAAECRPLRGLEDFKRSQSTGLRRWREVCRPCLGFRRIKGNGSRSRRSDSRPLYLMLRRSRLSQ